MTPGRFPRALVSAAVATALASAGLAAATTAPAAADPAESLYLCDLGGIFGEFEVALTVDVVDLPARLPVGVPVPAGSWDVEASSALPDLLVAVLIGLTGSITGATHGLALRLDDGSAAPVDLTSALEALPVAEPLDLPLSGTNREFVPGDVGEMALRLPHSYDLGLTSALGVPLFSAFCELEDAGAAEVGTVDVVKQTPSMTGKVLTRSVRSTRHAKVLVTVLNQLAKGANGSVVATLDGRTIGSGTLEHGAARLRLGRLPVGKHRVTLTYEGSRTVAKSMKKVTVKVVRPNH